MTPLRGNVSAQIDDAFARRSSGLPSRGETFPDPPGAYPLRL